jgi:DNA (cytosine-5)-methyltransferase 1
VPDPGDVTALDWAAVPPVDLGSAGWPCQDISYAGPGAGITEGTRSGLWLIIADGLRRLRPGYVFLEDVAALRTRGLGEVLGDLAALGYDAQWVCLRAADAGAPHRRDRLLLLYLDNFWVPDVRFRAILRCTAARPRCDSRACRRAWIRM